MESKGTNKRKSLDLYSWTKLLVHNQNCVDVLYHISGIWLVPINMGFFCIRPKNTKDSQVKGINHARPSLPTHHGDGAGNGKSFAGFWRKIWKMDENGGFMVENTGNSWNLYRRSEKVLNSERGPVGYVKSKCFLLLGMMMPTNCQVTDVTKWADVWQNRPKNSASWSCWKSGIWKGSY